MDNQREETKKSKLSLLLVLLLILLLLTSCTAGYFLGRIGYLGYTGRIIDVIYLTPSQGTDVEAEFQVSSEHTGEVWEQSSLVGIFTANPETNVFSFNDETVIAPGAKGKYVFRLFNSSNAASLYYILNLVDSDMNDPKLPLKYRLMYNDTGEYVGSDEWVSASEIKIYNEKIKASDSDVLVLEWKWVEEEDSKDTAIGTQEGSTVYILEIIVTASYEKWSN